MREQREVNWRTQDHVLESLTVDWRAIAIERAGVIAAKRNVSNAPEAERAELYIEAQILALQELGWWPADEPVWLLRVASDWQLHTLYTIGYSGQTLAGLRAHLNDLGAVLVDIRYSTRSRVKHWRGPELQAYFGDRYWSLACLGNENYRGGPIKLADPALAVAPMRTALHAQPVILMCGCPDVQECHRKDAAAFLQEQLGVRVVHLPPPARALLTENQIAVVKAMRDGWTLRYQNARHKPYQLSYTETSPIGGWITDRRCKNVHETTIRALENKGVIAKSEDNETYHLNELGNALPVEHRE